MRVEYDGPGQNSMAPLTVLSVAFPLAPVAADAVGGAEQVLGMLDAALVEAGHRSLVVACEGSRPAGRLIPISRCERRIDEAALRAAQRDCRAAIAGALERWPVDVVHLHGLDFIHYLPPPGTPALVTLHLPPHWYPPGSFSLDRADVFLHCVSAAQRRACPPEARLLPEIPNGVRLDAWTPAPRRQDYVTALGRICPEKGFHLALDAAARAGQPLRLAGRVFAYPEHEAYYHEQIAPRLRGGHQFVGAVSGEVKRRLLAEARCLLAPSLVPETSSLVAMEALACGTPVIAYPLGALVDIVEHGRTGFLVNDVSEMADAIRAARSLDPEECRRAARERFSAERMAAEYLALYARLARRAEPAPVLAPWR